MSKLAIYPGTFDPVTYGHIDVIRRAGRVFDEIIVGVAVHTSKKTLFAADERLAMIREEVQDFKNVRVETFSGLVIEYARQRQANVLIRGIRMFSDFEFEFQMALTNRRLDESIETVFLMPSENHSYLSSTLIKEVVSLGADISTFVPKAVAKKLKERLTH